MALILCSKVESKSFQEYHFIYLVVGMSDTSTTIQKLLLLDQYSSSIYIYCVLLLRGNFLFLHIVLSTYLAKRQLNVSIYPQHLIWMDSSSRLHSILQIVRVGLMNLPRIMNLTHHPFSFKPPGFQSVSRLYFLFYTNCN